MPGLSSTSANAWTTLTFQHALKIYLLLECYFETLRINNFSFSPKDKDKTANLQPHVEVGMGTCQLGQLLPRA